MYQLKMSLCQAVPSSVIPFSVSQSREQTWSHSIYSVLSFFLFEIMKSPKLSETSFLLNPCRRCCLYPTVQHFGYPLWSLQHQKLQ